ncbi:MAG: twin arginine-targeting protein translocase TatC [Gammaproteobacteria bacterium RIFCSPHIGHO2_12_FULL_40_19]|nr:MAG: twin arginine-targeting protein translocase TatC [Gammaproteobacteria bacterium RIFCSPHIGHO2_12_FULL_40_19]
MKNSIVFLIELRARILRVLITWGIIAAIFSYFANSIYNEFALPILHQLTPHEHLIATAVTTPFFVPLQSAMVASIYVCAPVLLYQLWQFILPALYRNERRFVFSLILLGTLLFYIGTLFSYFIVLPMMFRFLAHFSPAHVVFMPDISAYFDFVTRMLLAFGFAFELPVVIVVLIWLNVLSQEQCKNMRPYVIVGCFVLGMLLTPPDVLSQTLLAVPMWGLFELGVYIARRISRKK